ncbi:MAG: TonB-dependent receptor [Ignavibacteriaceae bacterium]|nr:TonB-dependent receptor [Ignavibacteriaceae bacterium]
MIPQKLFLFTFIIFLPILSNELNAQSFGKLRGFVTDSTNGEALAYGNVFIAELNNGASTDARGYYIINNISAGKKLNVVFSYVGYRTQTIQITIVRDEITQLNVALVPERLELQTVEKIGEKIQDKNPTDIGLQKLTLRQLEILPKGVETDVFRSLKYLPGVQATGDVSARYYVRGGTGDQNLVLLNGVTIYNPFHALGLFSVIDPEMINSVEFYKGGFAAEYGSRLSSVLSVITKNGNKNNFSLKASSSYLTGKALVEGPIPHGSFMFTGRKSYSNSILKKFLNDKNVPIDFYDASFKINYSNPDFIENGKFSLFGFLSGDKLNSVNPKEEDFDWSTNLIGFEWLQVHKAPIYSKVTVSLSQFNGEVIPNESKLKPRKNAVSDFSGTMDFTYLQDSEDEIGAGFHFKILSTNLKIVNQKGIKSEIDSYGGNFTLYGKYRVLRFDNFSADAGLRINSGLNSSQGFYYEPRISMNYRLSQDIALKAAWGIYQQEVVAISDENEVISLFDPWIIIPNYLNTSQAIHYIAGFDIDVLEDLSLKVEGYYKRTIHLPFINEEKAFEFEPDLISGRAESYGYEISINYSSLPVIFITSYSLGYAYKQLGNHIYYPKYDVRHSLSTSFEYNFSSDLSASIVWSFSSGLPFTRLIGYYDKYYLSDLYGSALSNTYYEPYPILGDKNIGRLPVYHRLDFNLSKKFEFSFLKFYIDLNIINVYNRKNIFYFKRDTGERVNMLPFLPTATLKIEI